MEQTSPPLVARQDSGRDADHLRLLSIFHYVYGGLQIALCTVFLFHCVLGLLMLTRPEIFGPNPPPTWLGALMMGLGAFVILLGWGMGICTIYSARCLARRERRTFSVVMAAINCLSVPFGTALGVSTLIVLSRDSVRQLYGVAA